MLSCATKKRKNATKLGAKGTTYKVCYKPKVKKVATHKMPDGSIMTGKTHKPKRKTTVEPIRRQISAVGQKKQLMKQIKQKVKKVYKSRWSSPLTPTLPSNPRY